MAAHVAALSGALAAAAAASQAGAAESRGAPTMADPGASASPSPNASDGTGADPGASVTASGIGDLLRVSSRGGSCGCAPCWGPPAPPAMTPELFALFDDVEVAS